MPKPIRFKSQQLLLIISCFLVLAIPVFGAMASQEKSYKGSITSVDYQNHSLVLLGKVAWYQKLLGSLLALNTNEAIRVNTDAKTSILIKSGSSYKKTTFDNLKMQDQVSVKGVVTEISLSSYPPTILLASEIKILSRENIVSNVNISPAPVASNSSGNSSGSKSQSISGVPVTQAPTSSTATPIKEISHNECKNNKCYKVSGDGQNQCYVDSDCLSVTNNANGVNGVSGVSGVGLGPILGVNAFSISSQSAPSIFTVDKSYYSDSSIALNLDSKIKSLDFSGYVTLNKVIGYARLVLVDSQNNEYLVYDSSNVYDGVLSKAVTNFCQETCILNSISVKSIRIEMKDASLKVDQFRYLKEGDSFSQGVNNLGLSGAKSQMATLQQQTKLANLNNLIASKHLSWTASETLVSKMPYSQKKLLFGLDGGEMPNLQGFEYYKGGVFETESITTTDSSGMGVASSNFPASWDWRDRHGEDWLTSVKNQLVPNACGSCWAHATIAGLEAFTNLYYNQHLNLDLSEQDLVSCSGAGSCKGGSVQEAAKYIKSKGVVDEGWFSYQGKDLPCSQKPSGGLVVKTANYGLPLSHTKDFASIKEHLMKNGPIPVGLISVNHAMLLVGWETDPVDNREIWLYKDTAGLDIGVNGYHRFKDNWGWSQATYFMAPVIKSSAPAVRCVDNDNDGYCNWGIGSKPATGCPVSCVNQPLADCDDSKSNLTYFESNYLCHSAVTSEPVIKWQGINQDQVFKKGDSYTLTWNVTGDRAIIDKIRAIVVLNRVAGGNDVSVLGEVDKNANSISFVFPAGEATGSEFYGVGYVDLTIQAKIKGEWSTRVANAVRIIATDARPLIIIKNPSSLPGAKNTLTLGQTYNIKYDIYGDTTGWDKIKLEVCKGKINGYGDEKVCEIKVDNISINAKSFNWVVSSNDTGIVSDDYFMYLKPVDCPYEFNIVCYSGSALSLAANFKLSGSSNRYACNISGNCVSNSSGPYTSSDCNNQCHTSAKYACDASGNCVQSSSGSYTSSDCNNQCQLPITHYSCNTSGSCVSDSAGPYTSSDCNNQCQAPITKYTCNSSYQCVIAASGQYLSLNDCQSACQAPITHYSCNTSGSCVSDPSGTYTTSNCNNQCHTSTQYYCNSSTHQCSTTPNSTTPYTNSTACQSACQASVKYACNSAFFYCYQSSTGQYNSITDCQNNCKSTRTASCHTDKEAYVRGETLNFSCTGLTPWTAVTMMAYKDNNYKIAQLMATSSGEANWSFIIPSNWSDGVYTIRASGSMGMVSDNFTLSSARSQNNRSSFKAYILDIFDSLKSIFRR